MNAIPSASNTLTNNGTWSPVGDMIVARFIFASSLLQNGKVLACGGVTSGYITTETTEIFDPSTEVWSEAAMMSVPRTRHTATVLSNGKVLVAGGRSSDPGHSLSSTEIYDPQNDVWTPVGNMNHARDNHTATLLKDGRVLVTGGVGIQSQSLQSVVEKSAEIYDPQTGKWDLVEPMSNARYHHGSTLMQNGRVLVTGGNNPGPHCLVTATTEEFDPQTGRWKNLNPMSTPRKLHGALMLTDGSMIVVGGITLPVSGVPVACNSFTSSAEIFDPAIKRWKNIGSLTVARNPTWASILLNNGSVMVAGGFDKEQIFATAEIYDPVSGAWSLVTPMHQKRRAHTLTLLADGRVLTAGGDNPDGIQATSELFYI